jgi:hypothetical protein
MRKDINIYVTLSIKQLIGIGLSTNSIELEFIKTNLKMTKLVEYI